MPATNQGQQSSVIKVGVKKTCIHTHYKAVPGEGCELSALLVP